MSSVKGWGLMVLVVGALWFAMTRAPASGPADVAGTAVVPPARDQVMPVTAQPAAARERKSDPLTHGSGQWNRFSYLYVKGPDAITVTFTPFLPRNDEVVIGAMRHVSQLVLSIDISSSQPELAGGVIYFRSGSERPSFVLVKEDTGEVHSFVVRR